MGDIQREVVGRGMPASPGTATGPVRFVEIDYPDDQHEPVTVRRAATVESGDVLVTEELLPSLVDAARRAVAIVTVRRDRQDRGPQGMTSKGAVVGRDLGLPTVVGCSDIRPCLREGTPVRVDGDEGRVFV